MKSFITAFITTIFIISALLSCGSDAETKECEFYDITYCDENNPSLCVLFRSDGTYIYKTNGGTFTTTDCITLDTNVGNIKILQVTNKAIRFYYFKEYTYLKI